MTEYIEASKGRNVESTEAATPRSPRPHGTSELHSRFDAPHDVHDVHDVIVAIAAPPGRARRGIVRISGERCFDLLERLLRLRSSLALSTAPRAVHPAVFALDACALPVLALLFPGAASYTGEPSIELQLPGNPHLLARVVNAVIHAGASRGIAVRAAGPGEFTARAFMNGRLSLTEAEGIAAAIAAHNDAALRAAHQLLSGRVGAFVRALGDDLANALALVEAGIDFTDEEDVIAIDARALRARLIALQDAVERELQHAVGAESLNDAPWVVLAGAPNAGKSTLFNALLGRTRAVVSEVAGTTRDVLVEPLHVPTPHGEAEVMLVDVAGEERSAALGEIDAAMQRMRMEALQRAELVLRCMATDDVSRASMPSESSTPTIIVHTKSDLHAETAALGHGAIAVSAASGGGLDTLRSAIGEALSQRAVSLRAEMVALRPRHDAALRSALAQLCEAIALLPPQETALPYPEIVASSMRSALDALRDLAGDITPDDVLGRIFATFCIGK